MVKETVPKNSVSLQLELIDSCSNYGDHAEAAYWARWIVFIFFVDFYALQMRLWLQAFRNTKRKSSNSCKWLYRTKVSLVNKHLSHILLYANPIHQILTFYSSKNQNSEVEPHIADSVRDSSMSSAIKPTECIHMLSLEPSKLILVDTRNKFYTMLRSLVVEDMVAFDAEWKPTFFSTNEVALIQLVIRNSSEIIQKYWCKFYAGNKKASLSGRCRSTGCK